jgi:glycosyltransferase involved in cell wall biosynthesis
VRPEKDGWSGIEIHTIQMINNLLRIDDQNSYYIYLSHHIPKQIPAASANIHYRVAKPRNRKVWQQINLPIAAYRDGLELMYFPANSVSLFCPCKSVATIHDLHPYIIPERYGLLHSATFHGGHIRNTINQIYWKQMLRLASWKDKVIAVSASTKNDIEKLFNVCSNKIEVVYCGIERGRFAINESEMDLTAFRQQYSLPDRYILCLGTHAYKNVEGSINAFHRIKAERSDSLKLVIAGSKRALAEHVFELVKELDLEREVVFTGYFPDEDLKYLYRAAEIFLFPSLYEGFGLPVLEAYACGVPVVTSETGSLPEAAGGAALLVNPHDAEDIAVALERLLQDGDLRELKRKQGYEQLNRFSWEQGATKLVRIFTQISHSNCLPFSSEH